MEEKKIKKNDIVVLKKSKIELTIIEEVSSVLGNEKFFIAKLNNGVFKGETFKIKEEEIIKKAA